MTSVSHRSCGPKSETKQPTPPAPTNSPPLSGGRSGGGKTAASSKKRQSSPSLTLPLRRRGLGLSCHHLFSHRRQSQSGLHPTPPPFEKGGSGGIFRCWHLQQIPLLRPKTVHGINVGCKLALTSIPLARKTSANLSRSSCDGASACALPAASFPKRAGLAAQLA